MQITIKLRTQIRSHTDNSTSKKSRRNVRMWEQAEHEDNPSTLLFTDVYTWGEASQTGHKTTIDDKNNKVKIPLVLEEFEMKRVVQVVSSNEGCLVLTASGEVWGWGTCFNKQKRKRAEAFSRVLSSSPHRLPELAKYKVKRIAATTPGGSHTKFAVITDEGVLITWTAAGYTQREGLGRDGDWSVPDVVTFPPDEDARVVDVCLGESTGICLLENQKVFTWGHPEGPLPAWVSTLSGIPIRQIAAGGQGWFAVVSADNDLYTWGESGGSSNGDYLGHGNLTYQFQTEPKLVEQLRGIVQFVSCGYIHAGAVTVNGDVYTWGDRDTNRLGHADITGYVHLPKLNKTLSGKGVVQLSHARGNEAAVTAQGELYVWGGHTFGGQFNHVVPTLLSLWDLRGNRIQSVSVGRSMTTLLTTRRLTLKDICIRWLCNHLLDIPNFHGEDLPIELREYMAYYLHDRQRLTPDCVEKLGVNI